MKYIDREELSEMIKEVTGASTVEDYGGRMTYKQDDEDRQMFQIYENKEEKNLFDKNVQENIIINKILDERLKQQYQKAKEDDDRLTMHYIEDRDSDYINNEKSYIRKNKKLYDKLDERMNTIYKKFEECATKWNKKDGEIYIFTVEDSALNFKNIKVLLATLDKDLVKEVYNSFIEWEERQVIEAEKYGLSFKSGEEYKIIKYSDLVNEYEQILSNSMTM